MDMKAAVKVAKEYVMELFADENITNLGLEEVDFYDQDEEWIVTLGFSRPWDEPRNTLASLAQSNLPRRSYKLVRIHDETETVRMVKNREVPLPRCLLEGMPSHRHKPDREQLRRPGEDDQEPLRRQAGGCADADGSVITI